MSSPTATHRVPEPAPGGSCSGMAPGILCACSRHFAEEEASQKQAEDCHLDECFAEVPQLSWEQLELNESKDVQERLDFLLSQPLLRPISSSEQIAGARDQQLQSVM